MIFRHCTGLLVGNLYACICWFCCICSSIISSYKVTQFHSSVGSHSFTVLSYIMSLSCMLTSFIRVFTCKCCLITINDVLTIVFLHLNVAHNLDIVLTFVILTCYCSPIRYKYCHSYIYMLFFQVCISYI